MANHRIDQFVTFMKRELDLLEEQKITLFKARALTEVSLEESFLDKPKNIRHAYLSALDDILEEAVALNDTSTEHLETEINKQQEDCSI